MLARSPGSRDAVPGTWRTGARRIFSKILDRLNYRSKPPMAATQDKHDHSTLKDDTTTATLPLSQQPERLGRQPVRQGRETDEISSHAAGQLPMHSQRERGFFTHANLTTIRDSAMIDMSTNYYDHERSMKSLVKHIIRGAEFDSSARSPPPRCHPGTRKKIMEKAQRWFHDSDRQKKILWLVGPAGGGKSAIMQTLAEYAAKSSHLMLGATLFFSRPNGRNKPSRVIFTIAYQIAVKHTSYREFVLQEMVADPQLPEKSMEVQFTKLIVEPLGQQGKYQGRKPLLILLDGLDECEGDRAQREIIELVSSFSLAHPTAPIIWVIASRPEAHLQAVFSRKNVIPSYDEEEVPIDSDEACTDVERYLRKEFERIQQDNPILCLPSQWPTESKFVKVAAAAGGLFAYASTVISFIDDLDYANPVSRLRLLLAVIDKASISPSERKTHPLAHLDLLYTCILSQIPERTIPDTRRLLASHFLFHRYDGKNLAWLCNWLGITSNDIYAALHRLHSVIKIPSQRKAEKTKLAFHHQSFYEYLKDSGRSRVFHISDADIQREGLECSVRILKEVHSGMVAKAGAAVPISSITLLWPVADKGIMRNSLYNEAGHLFTRSIYYYKPSLVLPKIQDPDVVHVMKTLNMPGLRVLSPTIPHAALLFHFVRCTRDAKIRTELHKQQLFREISVATLRLNAIGDKIYAYCEYTIRCQTDRRRIVNLFHGPHEIAYESKYRYWWCNHFPASDPGPTSYLRKCLAPLRQIVLEDLQHAQMHSPNMPVVLFGNVTFNFIVYDFTTPDESTHWTYFVSYTE